MWSRMQARKRALVGIVTVLFVGHFLAVAAQLASVDPPQPGKALANALGQNHSQVLIIGGGASGVAAASKLLENGVLDVTILEAEDRLGGRINTIPFGNDVVDMGAQWVHGEVGNVVYEMAQPLGLLAKDNETHSYVDNPRFMLGNGTELDSSLVFRQINISASIRNDEKNLRKYNGSLKQFHDEKFAEHTSNLGLNPILLSSFVTFIEKVWSFTEGTENLNEIEAKWFESNFTIDGDHMISWINKGYHSAIDLLTKKYPNPEEELPVRNKTHFSTEVKTIYWGPKKVVGPSGKKVIQVETSDGAKFTADFVLVTVSLGVLKESAKTMFNPPLAGRKLNAIQHIGFGHADKILLHFNQTWWAMGKNKTGIAVIPTNDHRLNFNKLYPQYLDKGEWTDGLTGFFSLPMQPDHVLMDWIVGRPARNMEKYTDEEVKGACLKWLEMSLNQSVPEPVSFVRSKWYSNPHFRGSHSYDTIDTTRYRADRSHLAEPLVGQEGTNDVLFAGEATNLKSHSGNVHGAIESGWREADRILNLLGGNALAQNHSQVLIIGGGASGVAAASKLLENGVLDVTILEAEDRLGGRINTIPFGNDVVDLGAQWVHGEVDNVVYEMARPLGLLAKDNETYSYFDNPRFLQGNGTELDSNLIQQLINISDWIRADEENLAKYNGSMKQFHDGKFAESTANLGLSPILVSSYLTWIEKVFAFSDATENSNELPANAVESYMQCPGDQGVNWINNGYHSAINLLTKKYPNPEEELPVRNKTHFSTEVKTIYWGPNKMVGPSGKKVVQVETSDGAKFTADFVLVTVSLGVLKESAKTMFNPPLAGQKLNAIQHIGFGHVDKILFHFNQTWWPTSKNKTGIAVLSTNEDRLYFNKLYPQYLDKGEWTDGLTGFFSLPMQPDHVLMDWIVGRPARNMEKYTDEEVKGACLKWLEMSLNQSVPEPVSFVRSKWYSNPHFRGSYSYDNIDSEVHDAYPSHLAEPLLGEDGTTDVLFAGEATNHKLHYSTVHGAVESGWREADRILALLGKKTISLESSTATTLSAS